MTAREPTTGGLLSWLSVTASVGLLALSLWLVDARSVARELASLDLRWLPIAFLLHLVQLALLGLRWVVLGSELGLRLGFARAAGEYALSVLVNQVLPSGIAGDALRALRHAQRLPDKKLYPAIELIAIDRASGQLALWLFVFATAPVGVAAQLVDVHEFLGFAALTALVIAASAFLMARARLGRRVLDALRLFTRRAARVLLRPASARLHMPLSLAFVVTTLLQLYVAARALGISLEAEQLLTVGPLILAASSIPASVGGWGLREGASALLFGAAGLGGSAGLSISLVYGFFSLIVGTLGFVTWLGAELAASRLRARGALTDRPRVGGGSSPSAACPPRRRSRRRP